MNSTVGINGNGEVINATPAPVKFIPTDSSTEARVLHYVQICT